MTDYGTTGGGAVAYTSTGQPMNIVVLQQPLAPKQDEDEIGPSGKPMYVYQNRLCGCCENWGNCCMVLWCFPFAACMVADRLSENGCYPLIFGMIPLSVRFRSIAKIEEGMCEEGCKWMCCPCLSMCRMMNELDTRSFAIRRS